MSQPQTDGVPRIAELLYRGEGVSYHHIENVLAVLDTTISVSKSLGAEVSAVESTRTFLIRIQGELAVWEEDL